jgi:sugar lactone lactonase YvrE
MPSRPDLPLFHTRGHPAAAIYDTDRIFADLRGGEPGVPDGMKVDVEGNVYCSGAGGIRITDPNG